MKVIKFVLLFLFANCALEEPRPFSNYLKQRDQAFRQCYYESNSYQGRDALAPENLEISFTISLEGEVLNEKITRSPYKDPNFHACILDQARRMKFKNIKNQKVVQLSINLGPEVK